MVHRLFFVVAISCTHTLAQDWSTPEHSSLVQYIPEDADPDGGLYEYEFAAWGGRAAVYRDRHVGELGDYGHLRMSHFDGNAWVTSQTISMQTLQDRLDGLVMGDGFLVGTNLDRPGGVAQADPLSVYRLNGGQWEQSQYLWAGPSVSFLPSFFSSFIALDGNRIAALARTDALDGSTVSFNAVYIYEWNGTQLVEVDSFPIARTAEFYGAGGTSVSYNNDSKIVIDFHEDLFAIKFPGSLSSADGGIQIYEKQGGSWPLVAQLEFDERKRGDMAVGDGFVAYGNTDGDNDRGLVGLLYRRADGSWALRSEFGYPANSEDFGIQIEADAKRMWVSGTYGYLLPTLSLNNFGENEAGFIAKIDFELVNDEPRIEAGIGFHPRASSQYPSADLSDFGYKLVVGGRSVMAIRKYHDQQDNLVKPLAYFLSTDLDDDGLPCQWEMSGIPYDSPSGVQFYPLPGSDPDHKNLYVEVDSMDTVALEPNAFSMVEQAFQAAPVSNPDGVSGIHLQFILDQSDLPYKAQIEVESDENPLPDDPDIGSSFSIRLNHFGSAAEQADPAWNMQGRSMREAKQAAFRYMYVGSKGYHNYASNPQDAKALGVALGALSWGGVSSFIYADKIAETLPALDLATKQAFTVMHEFGHNLGLGHGGGDRINGKPNYPSIMNYLLNINYDWCCDPSHGFMRTPDYARAESMNLRTLNELGLVEAEGLSAGSGLGRYGSFQMPYAVGGGAPNLRHVRTAYYTATALDFGMPLSPNGTPDGARGDIVVQDLNWFPFGSGFNGPTEMSPDQELAPFDDWGAIRLRIDTDLAAYIGSQNPSSSYYTLHPGCLRQDHIEELAASVAICRPDLNSDTMLNNFDVSRFTEEFNNQTSMGDYNNDGAWDFFDVSAFMTDYQAGCP